MSWNAQVLGGHLDGTIVPYTGPYLRLPKPRPVTAFLASEVIALPDVSTTWIDDYRLERGDDGELYYVLM